MNKITGNLVIRGDVFGSPTFSLTINKRDESDRDLNQSIRLSSIADIVAVIRVCEQALVRCKTNGIISPAPITETDGAQLEGDLDVQPCGHRRKLTIHDLTNYTAEEIDRFLTGPCIQCMTPPARAAKPEPVNITVRIPAAEYWRILESWYYTGRPPVRAAGPDGKRVISPNEYPSLTSEMQELFDRQWGPGTRGNQALRHLK